MGYFEVEDYTMGIFKNTEISSKNSNCFNREREREREREKADLVTFINC